MKKKVLAVVMGMVMTVSMVTGCGAGGNSSSEGNTDKNKSEGSKGKYKIAIVKQMDHASLDEIAEAVAAELDVISEEQGVDIEYEIYSGQGEQTTLKQIGEQAAAEGVDVMIPIASLAAQVMTSCAKGTDIPVVYAAVSDPESAELTDIEYVTGTSDALNTEFILDMMLKQNPDVKEVGLLYSLSEANSEKPISDAKKYLDDAGIKYVEQTASTNDEVIVAASSLVAEKVDAVFTPTDNVIMAAELAIYKGFADAGIPHYTGADSFVRNGAFVTCGVNYTALGTETAELAYRVITEGMGNMEDYYLMDGGVITVNTETAEMLNIDYSVFEEMGEIIEVETTEE